MNARHGRIGVLAALFVAVAAMSETPNERTPTWRVLEKLLSQESVLPEAPDAALRKPIPTERTFLFDDVLALEPAALLRGGAYVAVRHPAPTVADDDASAAHERRVNAELQAVFEYYPLIARTTEDFLLLSDAITSGTQPLALRRFLLRQCAPDTTPATTLSRYLKDHLADGATPLQEDLMTLILNPTEDGELQEIAVPLLNTLVSNGFTWILARDKQAVAHAKKTGAPLEIRTVLDAPNTMPLERVSSVRLEQQRQRAGVIAGIFSSIVRDEGRSPTLRALAKSSATALTQAYPLPAPMEAPPPPPPLPAPLEN